MSERHSLAWAGDVSPAVETYVPSMGKFLFSLFVVLLILPASARQIHVPTQPVSPYADTEVSTNVVVHTGRTDAREVKLHLKLEGTPTNDLEVAFGCDVNTNGVLDVSEVETVYGWRGGRYFIENVREWNRIETEAAGNAPCGVFDVQLKNGPQLRTGAFHGHLWGGEVVSRFRDESPCMAFSQGVGHDARRPAWGGTDGRVGALHHRP